MQLKEKANKKMTLKIFLMIYESTQTEEIRTKKSFE